MAGNPYITPKLFKFLRDLKKNNTREWFEENKNRYEEQLRGPLLDFIEDFSEHLSKISGHFEADNRKVGGSLFRIYRDVRFSKDKSPYKTHAGIHFRHESARERRGKSGDRPLSPPRDDGRRVPSSAGTDAGSRPSGAQSSRPRPRPPRGVGDSLAGASGASHRARPGVQAPGTPLHSTPMRQGAKRRTTPRCRTPAR